MSDYGLGNPDTLAGGSGSAAPTGAAGGDLTGTYPNPGVGKVAGVTITAGEATVLSQMTNAVTRNTSSLPATAAAGEETILTGSTAATTLTLPTTPQTSSINTIANLSTQSVTLAAGGSDTLSNFGTAGSITLLANMVVQVVYISGTTTWYVIDTNNSAQAVGILAIANGGTGASSLAALALGSSTATTQATSDNSTKLATTAYVTTGIANAVAGVNPAVAVQAATTGAANTSGFTYAAGVFTNTSNANYVVDGFTFTAVGQRLLVKNDTQTTGGASAGAFNGVYYVSTINVPGVSPIVLTRALDYNSPSEINNTGAIPVVNGTVNALTSWLLTSTVTTLGTDALTYTQFSFSVNAIPQSAVTSLVASGKTLTASNTMTLAAGADSQTFTFPAAGDTVVTLGASQTLTNKTLTTAALGSSTATSQAAQDGSTKVATTLYSDRAGMGSMGPAANGYLSWVCDPLLASANSLIMGVGTVYYTMVYAYNGMVVGHIDFNVSVAAASPANCFIGFYNAAGTQLCTSSEFHSTLGTNTGVISIAPNAGSSYTFTSSGFFFIGHLTGTTTTTAPTLRAVGSSTTVSNANLTAGTGGALTLRAASGLTSAAALPSPSATNQTGISNCFWYGLR